LKAQIEVKEKEKERLVARLGLVDAAALEAVTARLNQVSVELKELEALAKPIKHNLDDLRDRLRSILEQTANVREAMVTATPLKKKEIVRAVIKEIVVYHVPKPYGEKMVTSDLVAVEMLPHVGERKTFAGKSWETPAIRSSNPSAS
jgi:predicted nuclease with TOPRIM domain